MTTYYIKRESLEKNMDRLRLCSIPDGMPAVMKITKRTLKKLFTDDTGWFDESAVEQLLHRVHGDYKWEPRPFPEFPEWYMRPNDSPENMEKYLDWVVPELQRAVVMLIGMRAKGLLR